MRTRQDRSSHAASLTALVACLVVYLCWPERGFSVVGLKDRVVDGVINVEILDVKAVFKRIRFSRKFLIIVGGVLLLGGTTGVAAVFIGAERLLGPSYKSVNGLQCNTVQTVAIKKNGSFWVRKFIRTDGGDGMSRLKTALRVAQAIHRKQKPDLVQVSVLDAHGPQLRSEMRGRAIAAQVVYIPDEKKMPEGAEAQRYSAFYYDGVPNADGFFYGLRIDLPVEDVDHVSETLTDLVDCADPAADAVAGEHGEPAKGDGAEEGEHPATGHDAPAEKPKGHEAVQGGEHASPPVEEGNGLVDDEHLLTSTPEPDGTSIFSFAYIKSLIFGKGAITADAAEADRKPSANTPPARAEAAPEKPSH